MYNFLDPGRGHGKLAAYIVGIAVAECVIFCIVYGICVLREKVWRKRREEREEVGMVHI